MNKKYDKIASIDKIAYSKLFGPKFAEEPGIRVSTPDTKLKNNIKKHTALKL